MSEPIPICRRSLLNYSNTLSELHILWEPHDRDIFFDIFHDMIKVLALESLPRLRRIWLILITSALPGFLGHE